MSSIYNLNSLYQPGGDQPQSIAQLNQYLKEGHKHTTLHGITGSGKTFAMANVIANSNRPALIYSPNKILAYQLYEEFRNFFPDNAVHYYVSSFDFYLPEYVKNGEYHNKQSQKNDILEQMILETMNSLVMGRRDLIIITSSACLFGTGSPDTYHSSILRVNRGDAFSLTELKVQLQASGYLQVGTKASRGEFTVQGRKVEICISSYESQAVMLSITFDSDDHVKRIVQTRINHTTQEILEQLPNLDHITIFPATRFAHDVNSKDVLNKIVTNIKGELSRRSEELDPARAHFLQNRIEDDVNSILSYGYCSGIENYSWYFNRANIDKQYHPDMYYREVPYTIMNYLSEDSLIFIDESHLALGQIQGAHHSDFSRKKDLIAEGIRLPSCVINRPLKAEEFESFSNQVIYVSATPGDLELERSQGRVVKQFIRPTFLLDPEVIVYDDLEIGGIEKRSAHIIAEIKEAVADNQAILLRMSNTESAKAMQAQLQSFGIKAATMLAENTAPERRELVERLQGVSEKEQLDVIVGVNLIREGLDIPRVAKVILADIDSAGFLNDARSLIQVIGRAARNIKGKCILYTRDKTKINNHVKQALEQTSERRNLQLKYNLEHNKTPVSAITNSFSSNRFKELVDESYIAEFEDLE